MFRTAPNIFLDWIWSCLVGAKHLQIEGDLANDHSVFIPLQRFMTARPEEKGQGIRRLSQPLQQDAQPPPAAERTVPLKR